MIKSTPEHITLTDISTSPDDPKFEVYSDVDIFWTYKGKEYSVVVPAGFVTDLGSIPKIFRWWLSNCSVYNVAFILHDFCFSKLGPDFPQDLTDCMFRANLAFLGMNCFDRFCVYHAVKKFGKNRYKKVI